MIFGNRLRRLDTRDVSGSLRAMEDHIRVLQEQLEYTLYNLDSTNITQLDPTITDILTAAGGLQISGESLALLGKQGEQVVLGDQGGAFQIRLTGRSGQPAIYLDSAGRVVVGQQAIVHLDCGSWDQE